MRPRRVKLERSFRVLLKCVAVGLILYPAKSIAGANTINGDEDEQINLMKKGVKRVELCCAIFD